MMFQSYALFPHLSVKDNVGYGLRRKGVDKGEADKRVQAELETLEARKAELTAEVDGFAQERQRHIQH